MNHQTLPDPQGIPPPDEEVNILQRMHLATDAVNAQIGDETVAALTYERTGQNDILVTAKDESGTTIGSVPFTPNGDEGVLYPLQTRNSGTFESELIGYVTQRGRHYPKISEVTWREVLSSIREPLHEVSEAVAAMPDPNIITTKTVGEKLGGKDGKWVHEITFRSYMGSETLFLFTAVGDNGEKVAELVMTFDRGSWKPSLNSPKAGLETALSTLINSRWNTLVDKR